MRIVRCERTDGYGIKAGVPVGLDDYHRSRLTGVVWAACDGPDFAASHLGLSLAAILGEKREDGDGIDKILVVLLAGAAREGQGVAASLPNESGRIHVRKPDLVEAHSLAWRGAARGGGRLRRIGAGHGFSLRQGRGANFDPGSLSCEVKEAPAQG